MSVSATVSGDSSRPGAGGSVTLGRGAGRNHAWSRPGTPEELRRLLGQTVLGGVARQGVWLRLATLPAAWAKPHHLRLARAALEPLLMADRSRLFELADGDVVVVWRSAAEGLVQRCRAAVELLFSDAALDDPMALLHSLALPGDAPDLLRRLEAPRAPPVSAPPRLPPLDTEALARLESVLARADVARFARRRDVCALGPAGRFVPRWEERFLSLAELEAGLAPERDWQADPWLFRRLRRTLDHRLLALLSAVGELEGAGPFAVELNVASILAPEFLRFDAALPRGLRGQALLGIDATDLLADPSGFAFARDFTRARGYRMVLRGVAPEALEVLAPLDDAVDMLRLSWSPDLVGRPRLPVDPERLLLGGVDGPDALAWGVRRGIRLFEGASVARGRPVPPPDPLGGSAAPA